MSLHARGIEKHDVGDRTLYVAFDGVHERALSVAMIPNERATEATDEAFCAWLDMMDPPKGDATEPCGISAVHLVA